MERACERTTRPVSRAMTAMGIQALETGHLTCLLPWPAPVGVGGPVGPAKTSLMDTLCKRLRDRYDIAAITNDIYPVGCGILVRSGALPRNASPALRPAGARHRHSRGRIMNLAAVAEMRAKFPALDLNLIESGGDNLAATFHRSSPISRST